MSSFVSVIIEDAYNLNANFSGQLQNGREGL